MVSNLQFYRHNIRIYYLFEIFRALMFGMAVYVLYQRQYITASQYVFLEGIALAMQLFMELPTGAFADLLGRKTSLIIGYLIDAISILMLSFSTTFLQLFVMSIIFGIGESFISGAREALLYDTFKQANKEDEFSSMSSKFTLVFQIVLAAATVVGGFIGMIYLRLPIWMWAGFQLLTSLVSFWFIEPTIDSEKFTLKSYVMQTKRGVQELGKNSYIKKLSIYYVLVGAISWVCMLVFNSTLLVDLGYNAQEIGVTMGVLRVLNSVVLVRMVGIGRIFSRKAAILFFPILLIVSLTPGVLLTKWIAIPFVMGSMMASTARWVILSKYVNEEFESKNRATANSALSMAIGIFFVIFTFVSGPIMDNYGGTKTVFTLLGILSAVTILPLGIHLARNHARKIVFDTGK